MERTKIIFLFIIKNQLKYVTEYIGAEILNEVCEGANRGNGHFHWDQMSNKGYILSGLATDDVHHTSSVGKALTLIKAPKLDKKDILKAIENGCFYASKGPIIVDFFVDKNLKTSVKCSPFQKISF